MNADEIDYHLIGDDLQGVIVTLDPEEAVVAEAGAMMYMQDGIRMMTSLDMTGRGSSKLMDKLFAAGKRVLTPSSLRSSSTIPPCVVTLRLRHRFQERSRRST